MRVSLICCDLSPCSKLNIHSQITACKQRNARFFVPSAGKKIKTFFTNPLDQAISLRLLRFCQQSDILGHRIARKIFFVALYLDQIRIGFEMMVTESPFYKSLKNNSFSNCDQKGNIVV